MKKFKNIIAMGCAAVMAMSMLCTGVFASSTTPEVITSYTTENNIKVQIFDSNISVEFTEKDNSNNGISLTNIGGSIYINKPNSFGLGAVTESFYCNGNARAKFGLDSWEGGPYYNVALYKVGVGGAPDSILALCEDVPKSQEATLSGITATGSYYFRVSTYYNPGQAVYYAYPIAV